MLLSGSDSPAHLPEPSGLPSLQPLEWRRRARRLRLVPVTGLAWACAGAALTAGRMVNVEAYSGSEFIASVTTNASHVYTMHLPPGTYTIRVPANAPEGVVDADQVAVTAGHAAAANFPNSCK